ncbi:MAG: THUMP domain-containing protein [Promethearchaeota archaeon]
MKQSQEQMCLFILSGEHETLPQAELCAILEGEKFPFKVIGHQNQILLLEVDPKGAKIATERSGLVNHASVVFFESPAEEVQILERVRNCDFTGWIKPKDRFGVKITRVQREPTVFDIDALASKVGSQIWQALKGQVVVDLTKPDVLFLGVINGNQFFLGPYLASRDRVGVYQRRSPLRPFFVPSAIHPKFARVMVNLSRVKRGDLLLDPFCGTGGLLLEAADIGCVPVGFDIDSSILAGCQQNLKHYKVPFNGALADARTIPLRPEGVNAIATDPPYGRSSSTKGSEVVKLIQTSLDVLTNHLKKGGYLCLALPEKYFEKEIIPTDSFAIIETHTMRIHRSLNRLIVVLQRQ